MPATCALPTVKPRARPTLRFLSAHCHWCDASFTQDLRVTGAEIRYCSKRCARSRSKHDRKAREHGAAGTFTLAELVRLWLAFDKCCAYCEQPTAGLPGPDHVVPLSRGGSNSITNILPSCRQCNTDKNDMTLDEWPADRGATQPHAEANRMGGRRPSSATPSAQCPHPIAVGRHITSRIDTHPLRVQAAPRRTAGEVPRSPDP